MPGTKAGGKKAAKTMKLRYGEEVYQMIGAAGGKASRGGGFAAMAMKDPDRHAELSRKGGQKSRRKKKQSEV